jgi:exosome complex component RRP4
MIKIEDRQLLVPGELMAEGSDYLSGEGTYRDGDNIYSSLLGIGEVKAKFLKVVPISGRYIPKQGDTVLGVVMEVMSSAWIVDVNAPYDSLLPLSLAVPYLTNRNEDITRFYDIGDLIVAKVANVSKNKQVLLDMKNHDCRKLTGGRIIEIGATKVPRLIGKSGTMISMIKTSCNCQIMVGQNGRIWIDCPRETEDLAIKAIYKIDNEAHIPGLTERIRQLLERGNANAVQ